jgi:hypothetical protein
LDWALLGVLQLLINGLKAMRVAMLEVQRERREVTVGETADGLEVRDTRGGGRDGDAGQDEEDENEGEYDEGGYDDEEDWQGFDD